MKKILFLITLFILNLNTFSFSSFSGEEQKAIYFKEDIIKYIKLYNDELINKNDLLSLFLGRAIIEKFKDRTYKEIAKDVAREMNAR